MLFHLRFFKHIVLIFLIISLIINFIFYWNFYCDLHEPRSAKLTNYPLNSTFDVGNITCLIDGNETVECLRASSEVYLPFFHLLRKKFDLSGVLSQDISSTKHPVSTLGSQTSNFTMQLENLGCFRSTMWR